MGKEKRKLENKHQWSSERSNNVLDLKEETEKTEEIKAGTGRPDQERRKGTPN